jgi:hypothetical protein
MSQQRTELDRLFHPIMRRIHGRKMDVPPIHKGQLGCEWREWHALRDMPLERLNKNVNVRLVGLSHQASHSRLQGCQIASRVGRVIQDHGLLRRISLRVSHGFGKLQGISGRIRNGPPGVLGQLL